MYQNPIAKKCLRAKNIQDAISGIAIPSNTIENDQHKLFISITFWHINNSRDQNSNKITLKLTIL